MTTTANPVTTANSVLDKSALILKAKRFAGALGIAVAILTLGVFMPYIALTFGELSPSWWLGFAGTIAVVVIVMSSYWAAHPATGRLGGTIIALATLVLALIGWEAITPVGEFNWGHFFYGLLLVGMILAAALIAFVYKYRTPK